MMVGAGVKRDHYRWREHEGRGLLESQPCLDHFLIQHGVWKRRSGRAAFFFLNGTCLAARIFAARRASFLQTRGRDGANAVR